MTPLLSPLTAVRTIRDITKGPAGGPIGQFCGPKRFQRLFCGPCTILLGHMMPSRRFRARQVREIMAAAMAAPPANARAGGVYKGRRRALGLMQFWRTLG